MKGFLSRAFAPLLGIGRALVAYGIGATGSGAPIDLPSGEVRCIVEDVEPTRLCVEDAEPTRVTIEDLR